MREEIWREGEWENGVGEGRKMEGGRKEESEVRKRTVVSSYKEPHNYEPIYGYNMLPNLSPNLYKIQSVYNNNVTS